MDIKIHETYRRLFTFLKNEHSFCSWLVSIQHNNVCIFHRLVAEFAIGVATRQMALVEITLYSFHRFRFGSLTRLATQEGDATQGSGQLVRPSQPGRLSGSLLLRQCPLLGSHLDLRNDRKCNTVVNRELYLLWSFWYIFFIEFPSGPNRLQGWNSEQAEI